MKTMSGLAAVWRKELIIYFSTPIFFFIGFFFLLLGGFFFYLNTAMYHQASFQAAMNPALAAQLSSMGLVFRPLFGNLAVVFLLLVPMMTMRLLAEEKRSGTAELLFTYPLSDAAVILGKFLAAWLVYLVLLGCTLVYVAAFLYLAPPDPAPLAAGYLGMALFGGACLSLGLFVSSLTENQIIAVVGTFALLLLFWIMGWYQEVGGALAGKVLQHLSLIEHLENFTRGVIDTRDFIYFVSFMFFFLFLTKRQLESRRWRA